MVLALMASGLNGQKWRFVGYVPIENEQRRELLHAMGRTAQRDHETQIVMDTPYRNQRLFEDLLRHSPEDAKLCVATGLTTADEAITVKRVREWRTAPTIIPKVPTLFLLG
jgi:16S rRNA (cytidine1402-2'-O)-methyltransferase